MWSGNIQHSPPPFSTAQTTVLQEPSRHRLKIRYLEKFYLCLLDFDIVLLITLLEDGFESGKLRLVSVVRHSKVFVHVLITLLLFLCDLFLEGE